MENQEQIHEMPGILRGELEIILRDKYGRIKEKIVKRNLIVNGGYDLVADSLGHQSSRPAIVQYLAIGTSAVAPSVSDTTLGTEVYRKAVSYSHTASATSMSFNAAFAAGEGTGLITEAGLFNHVSAGTMLNRVTFGSIDKQASDSLDVTFTISMS